MLPLKLKAIIIDDELLGVDALDKIISKYCKDVLVIARCSDPEEAVAIVHELKPDIVFLDIAMPRLNGFDFLNQFEKITFKIIFATAYSEYAMRAIKYAAFDYILKPIDFKEVLEAVSKVRNTNAPPQISTVVQNNHMNTNLALPTPDGFLFIDISEIIYCKSDNSYTTFVLKDGKRVLVSRSIRETGEMLERHSFFRIHQSFLVNSKCVRKYNKHINSITLLNGEELPVAVRKKDEFLLFASKL